MPRGQWNLPLKFPSTGRKYLTPYTFCIRNEVSKIFDADRKSTTVFTERIPIWNSFSAANPQESCLLLMAGGFNSHNCFWFMSQGMAIKKETGKEHSNKRGSFIAKSGSRSALFNTE